MAIMQPFAEKIFFGLVLIEIIITCVHFLTDQDEPTRLLAELVKKVTRARVSVRNDRQCADVVQRNHPGLSADWGTSGRDSRALARAPFSTTALRCFRRSIAASGVLGWFHLTIASLIALVAGLIMFLSFALIAGQMLLALSEAYIGVGGGVLMIGLQRFSMDDQVC